MKLRGALGNFGQAGVLPVDELVAGRGAAVASGLWERREAIREDAARLSGERRAASSVWWDRVVAALGERAALG
ncbi:hypothetical protein BH09ACT5_BH09ACT5_17290 [soil metagenome]